MKTFVFVSFLLLWTINAEEDCELPIQYFNEYSPLLICPGSESGIHSFYLPDEHGDIRIPHNTKFIIACAGGKIELNNKLMSYGEKEVTCDKREKFLIDGQKYDFKSIHCPQENKKSIRDDGTCLGAYSKKQIGFQLAERFLNLITVCFDDNLKTPIYSISEVDKNIQTVAKGNVKFIEEGQYGLSKTLADCYANQKETINSILHLDKDSDKFIKKHTGKSNQFFSAGHLVARSDFMCYDHQMCTYFYINTAPQWQPINEKSWTTVEKAVQSLAFNRKSNLEIVTGTYGILKLKKEDGGIAEEMYLYVDGREKALPVPEFYWKFVYLRETQEGVVIISTNSPVEGAFEKLCTDICGQLRWVKVDKKQQYCCTYADFKQHFGNVIEDYQVKMVLTKRA